MTRVNGCSERPLASIFRTSCTVQFGSVQEASTRTSSLIPAAAHLALHRAAWGDPHFCRAMLCISAAIAGTRCLSVCLSVRLSVTFVSCAKTNKDILEMFSPSGSQAILVFPHQTGWRYSDWNSPNEGVECKGGMKNLTIFDQYFALSQKRL